MPEFEIVSFQEDIHGALIGELTDLLHESYAPLAAEGMDYLASRQSISKTLERLLEGESWLFFSNDQLVGTVSLYEGLKKRVSADYYKKPGVYLFGQFAIRTSFQGRGWGSLVMDMLEQKAKERGARELALDTSKKASRLISMYKARGYQIVSETQWPDVSYQSFILAKSL